MPSPRRILLLITDLEIGGTPTVVRELALRLASACHIHVASLAPHGPVAQQIRAAGVPVTPLNARGPLDLAVLSRLASLIRTHQFDTLFSFLIHANAVAAAASLIFPHIRYIQSIQTTQPTPRWHWALQRLIHTVADRIVVPSPSVAHAAQDWAGVPLHRIEIIPNAVDLADFSPISSPPPQTRPLPIAFIGRLDPIKCIPDLLHAVRILKGLVHLHIFGSGPQRPAIESLITTLSLAPLVTLHGPVARPQDALAHAALLVLPSAAEGFGLVLIEAMAARVPIVATNVPGIRDVLRDGHTALLVPKNSPDRLAQAIARVATDADLRRRLINTASADVAQRFSWPKVIPQYRQLLALPTHPLTTDN